MNQPNRQSRTSFVLFSLVILLFFLFFLYISHQNAPSDPPSSISADVVRGELPALILSSLCILLGLFLSAAALCFPYAPKPEANAMGTLGLFSIVLGLWKLTSLRCIPLLFPRQAAAVEDLRAGALFLTALCLLRYALSLFEERRQTLLHLLSCAESLLCLLALAAHVLGLRDLRQNLLLSHILLITTLAALPAAALMNRVMHRDWGLRVSWKLSVLMPSAIAGDLLLYSRSNGSFSVAGVLAYALITLLAFVRDTTRKACIDSRTGLGNRTRWTELMNDPTPHPKPYAIVVVDLNGLKQVNDTLGHEAGDQMICRFAHILRSTLPRGCVLCRWGGDEFTALLTDMDRHRLERQTEALLDAAARYNADHPELPIHFAVGTALSSDHPELSRTDLFRLADKAMYRSKQLWYAQTRK